MRRGKSRNWPGDRTKPELTGGREQQRTTRGGDSNERGKKLNGKRKKKRTKLSTLTRLVWLLNLGVESTTGHLATRKARIPREDPSEGGGKKKERQRRGRKKSFSRVTCLERKTTIFHRGGGRRESRGQLKERVGNAYWEAKTRISEKGMANARVNSKNGRVPRTEDKAKRKKVELARKESGDVQGMASRQDVNDSRKVRGGKKRGYRK